MSWSRETIPCFKTRVDRVLSFFDCLLGPFLSFNVRTFVYIYTRCFFDDEVKLWTWQGLLIEDTGWHWSLCVFPIKNLYVTSDRFICKLFWSCQTFINGLTTIYIDLQSQGKPTISFCGIWHTDYLLTLNKECHDFRPFRLFFMSV